MNARIEGKMMKICIGEWFTLRFLGKEVFGRLMAAGVGYDPSRGFRFVESTNILAALNILSANIGEEIFLTLKCFICGKETECETCVYGDICNRGRVSTRCFCNTHFRDDDVSPLYFSKFESILAEISGVGEPSKAWESTTSRGRRRVRRP
jgi:hypothetical protein